MTFRITLEGSTPFQTTVTLQRRNIAKADIVKTCHELREATKPFRITNWKRTIVPEGKSAAFLLAEAKAFVDEIQENPHLHQSQRDAAVAVIEHAL